MNPLAIFKKPAQTGPARAAFKEQMRAYLGKLKQREQINTQDAVTRAHREAADAAAAKVQTLLTTIDQMLADHIYGDAEAPELEARRSEFIAAQREAERLAPLARAADLAHRRFAAQSTALVNEANAIYQPMPRLLHAALLEELEEDAVAFREMEEAFRARHRATFVKVAAADRLAMAHQLGLFTGWGLYGDLHVSRPNLPSYHRGSQDPWTNQQEHDHSLRTLDAEADALINKMLNAEV
jgi:hypothetical protein